MKSFRDRNPYLVGALSVLVILALVGGAFAVGVLHVGERAYRVTAVFSDAAGIRAGDHVRMAGVKCGRVESIEADRQNGNVKVVLVVNRGIQLGPDTHAEVALETLLGTKFVRLSGQVVQPYLENGAVIPRERTKTPFDVFDLFGTATRNVQATDTQRLNQLITELADISAGKHDQIAQLLNAIAEVSRTVNARDAQLRELLDRSEKLTGTLAEKDQTLVALLERSQGILDLVQRRKDDIAAALHDGNALVGELARLIGADKAQLDVLLGGLHPTLEVVAQRQSSIDAALAVVGPGALGLGRAPTHGPWQDIYVRAVGPDVGAILANLTNAPQPGPPAVKP